MAAMFDLVFVTSHESIKLLSELPLYYSYSMNKILRTNVSQALLPIFLCDTQISQAFESSKNYPLKIQKEFREYDEIECTLGIKF